MLEKEIPDYLESAQAAMYRLNQWEQEFIESISDQFTQRGSLSEAQMEKLEQIVDEKC